MDEGKHPIKINLTPSAMGSDIEIDGVKVPYVKAVRIDARVGEVTTVALEVLALGGVKITGEVSKVEKKTVDGAVPEDDFEFTEDQLCPPRFTNRHWFRRFIYRVLGV